MASAVEMMLSQSLLKHLLVVLRLSYEAKEHYATMSDNKARAVASAFPVAEC